MNGIREPGIVGPHQALTETIIGCAFKVYNQLGFGFLESVYEKCLAIELRKAGLKADLQSPIVVTYSGEEVGHFVADILVHDSVLVELKSVRALNEAHEMQRVNYLTATGVEIGLLINFGEQRDEVRRKLRTLPSGKSRISRPPS